MSTTTESVQDVRRARGDVSGLPELRTPGGRTPLDPRVIVARYDIVTGELLALEVRGPRLELPPHSRWAERYMTRRMNPADLHTFPAWVQEFVARHRPTPTSAARRSARRQPTTRP